MVITNHCAVIACLAVWWVGSGILGADESLPRAVIKTSEGEITVALNLEAAPKAVALFEQFIRERVYEDSSFHEVPDGNEIQGGKPGPQCATRSGSGNYSYTKAPPGEFTLKHQRGAVVFAHTVGSCNPTKTNNSTQFCIYAEDKPQNENQFTVFGRVVAGMDVVIKIIDRLKKHPKDPVKISSVQLER